MILQELPLNAPAAHGEDSIADLTLSMKETNAGSVEKSVVKPN